MFHYLIINKLMMITDVMLVKYFNVGSVFFLLLTNIYLILRQLNNSQCSIGNTYDLEYVKNYQDNQNKFEKKETEEVQKPSYSEYNVKDYEISEGFEIGFNVSFDLGRWDKSKSFKMFDYVHVGEEYGSLSKKYMVCMATQSSIEKLHSIAQVSEHWTGPISVAIYAAGDEEYYLLHWYVHFLKNCYPWISKRVSFHLGVPKLRIPTGKYPENLKNLKINNYKCRDYKNVLKEIIKLRPVEIVKWRMKNPYPQNHMRNLARKNCQSDYVFLTDVDIVPSFKLADNLNKFLKTAKKTCKNKCAYVIPTYELDSRTDFPKNKSELLRLSQKGLARAFHQKVFIYNQFATNFSK